MMLRPLTETTDKVDLSRRRLLIAGSTIYGSLLLGLPAIGLSRSLQEPGAESQIGFFINIQQNGDVIIGNNQPEIGL